MHRHNAVAVAVLFALACSDRSEPTSPVTVAVYSDAAAKSDNANDDNLGTRLAPENEVMPAGVVNTSRAVGNAIFQLSDDGQELSYKLIVANIENVFQAHIHQGAVGSNGGIVVWLYPSTAPVAGPLGQGRIQGVIAEGVITRANLVNALKDKELSDLLALITSEQAYVNVHTNDGVAPTNTGPGDYPGGELRGQLLPRGQ